MTDPSTAYTTSSWPSTCVWHTTPAPRISGSLPNSCGTSRPPRMGAANRSPAVPYIRTYLAAHAAKARVLDQLVNDPGFLLAADRRARLLATLATVTDPQARKSASAFESMQHLQPGRPPGQAAAQLDLAARAHGATVLADGIGHLPQELP